MRLPCACHAVGKASHCHPCLLLCAVSTSYGKGAPEPKGGIHAMLECAERQLAVPSARQNGSNLVSQSSNTLCMQRERMGLCCARALHTVAAC